MRDRLVIVQTPTEHVSEVTRHVHEHRAPTDASVRLLGEMEAAARDKIVEAIQVGDTTFSCVVHIEHNFANDDRRLMAVFSLNGKNMTAEHVAREIDYDRSKAFLALRDAIAVKIATEILVPALRQMEFSNGRIR